MKRKSDPRADADEGLAIQVLGWLAEDEDRLLAFANATGLLLGTLRESAGDPGFLGAVLDHVMGYEPLLLACAEALSVKPERIAQAWQRLQPREFDDTL